MDELPIVKKLGQAAITACKVYQVMAESKTARNQAAGDASSNYGWLKPEQTLEAQAAALIRAQHEALESAREWLEGWASAEPYLSVINAVLELAKESK